MTSSSMNVSHGQKLLCFATLAVIIFTIASAAAVVIVHVSSQDGESEDIVSGKGTVRFMSIEGGFYGIVGDDGKHYDPHDSLDQRFRVDGLRVRFKAQILHDVACFHMWGQIIEILWIVEIL